MRNNANQARKIRVAFRLTKEEQCQLEATAKAKGYANPSAFIRAAIRKEMDGRAELSGTEERIAAGFDRVSRDVFRVGRAQQAMFALFDAYVKVMLTCVPEPPSDASAQAVTRAKGRYERLVKAAGQGMSGDARGAMRDLVDNGSK